MKHLKKTPIYFAIFAASIFLSVFLHILVERNYNDFKMMLVENGRHEASTKVNSMISKIDTYRKTNTEAEVKNIVYDTLSNHVGLNNQYIWINEIVDWNGGEEYAVRFVNPNFPGQQGQPSSKGLKDIDGNPLYLIETQALKDTGELYYQYYFKNYLNEDVELKSSYIKLYKDYNWVIGCGIPKSELFERAQFTHTRNRQLLFLFYVSLALLNFIIFFVIYTQDKKQELKNNAKMIELKANSKIEAKSEFFSTLSHELRTPLNAIIGLNDLMRDNSNGNQVVMDYSYKIEESSKILLNLINDVLDMSAIEKGKLNIANETFVLKNIIYSISDTYYILAKKKSLDFKIHLDNIHHESLIGDQYRIRQILSNLLSNSLKFTEEGSISLDIKEEVTDDNTLNLLFDVVDTGCGIKEEVMPRLFGQFEQADATVVSKHGGSGLGLSIVKHLVSEMNGTIEVHSKYQSGSKFSVSIPLKIAESDTLYENKLEKQSALIVFNDTESLNCISKMLNSWNVKNTGFTSSLKALEYIKKNPQSHTIYIFDLYLPDLDGFGLTKAVRTLSKATIIIANYDFNELKEKNNNRATAFIQKPIFKSTLYNYIVNKEANDIINVNNTNLVRYDGFKVLSVEDNKINQMIIKNILNKVGINVFTASNGLEAIEFIKTNEEGDNLDLIFMDIRMPDMDGITATKEIRKFNTTTPIIALSANAFEEDIKKSNEAGMNNHLSKPIDKILLNEILKTYLIKKD